jgi:hypothetical protein
MIVYRISDGSWFPLFRFGLNGGSSARFGWFYGYKEFIETNESHGARAADFAPRAATARF